MGNATKQTRAPKRPKKPKKARKAELRRHELLDAAMDLVAEKGLDALTMAGFAASVDVAVGVLYHYFNNKQDLLAALQHRALEQFGEDFRDDLKQIDAFLQQQDLRGNEDPTAALARILIASHIYLYEGDRSPVRHKMMNASLAPIDAFMSEELAQDVAQTIQTILSLIERIMLDAVSCGALQQHSPFQAWQRTYILWSHLHGLTLFRKRDRLQPPYLQVQPLFQEGLTSLLLGWGASHEIIQDAFTLASEYLQNA